DRVQDAVSPRKRLDQAVVAQVLVHEQGIQRRGVKTSEKHVNHNDQVNLAVLQPQRQVLVVVLESIGRGVVVGAKHRVVVRDRLVQEGTVVGAHVRRVHGLIRREGGAVHLLVRGERGGGRP